MLLHPWNLSFFQMRSYSGITRCLLVWKLATQLMNVTAEHSRPLLFPWGCSICMDISVRFWAVGQSVVRSMSGTLCPCCLTAALTDISCWRHPTWHPAQPHYPDTGSTNPLIRRPMQQERRYHKLNVLYMYNTYNYLVMSLKNTAISDMGY